jgi:hypothetical protein
VNDDRLRAVKASGKTEIIHADAAREKRLEEGGGSSCTRKTSAGSAKKGPPRASFTRKTGFKP